MRVLIRTIALGCGLALAMPLGPSQAAVEPASASSDNLAHRLAGIERDLEALHRDLLAANSAADPAARAAAVDRAAATLARLVQECREVESLYSGLQGSLPRKAGAAAGTVSADLAAIVADLDAAASDLDAARSTLASLR